MDSFINDCFFVIDSENYATVTTKLYGYCVANEASQVFDEQMQTSEIINNINPENYSDGAYVLVQNFQDEIKISQDFNGGYGLYLYKKDDFFALSSSDIADCIFLLPVDTLTAGVAG